MYTSIEQIKQANKAIDHKWFDQGAMAFFNTKIESDVIRGWYFITSDYPSGQPKEKMYSIRYAKPNGAVNTWGEFRKFKTLAAARKYIATDCPLNPNEN